MVFGLFGSSDTKWPEGKPVKLPSYFPVQPKGCETQSQTLFSCVSGPALEKRRAMEKAGYHKSYFADVETKAMDEKYAEYTEDQNAKKLDDESRDASVPKREDNPLNACIPQILQYQKCCDRALKQKRNWILTETVRVEKVYRYQGDANKNES